MASQEVELAAFADQVNKQYDTTIIGRVSNMRAMRLNRFSSGSISLDIALGGGWPFNRIAVISGDESTGKSVKLLKAFESVQYYCHNCRKFGGIMGEDGKRQFSVCTCETFVPCSALWMDIEGVFDPDWAMCHGWNDVLFQLSRPETAEQALDILDAAIRKKLYDAIVVDSIAALTPLEEIEKSFEDVQVGAAARLVNKSMRKTVASLNMISQESEGGGPLVFFVNQMRTKMVQNPHQDPRVLPGGRAQLFSPSIMIYTKTSKVFDDGAGGEKAFVTLAGNTKKNKTAPPKQDYEFDMALKNIPDRGIVKGQILNYKEVAKQAVKYGVAKQVGDNLGIPEMGVTFKSEQVLSNKLKADRVLMIRVWREVIKVACDQVNF